MPTGKNGKHTNTFSTLITTTETEWSRFLSQQLVFVVNNICTRNNMWCIFIMSLGSDLNVWHMYMCGWSAKPTDECGSLNLCCASASCPSSFLWYISHQVSLIWCVHIPSFQDGSELRETTRGCSGDRWKGNLCIGRKQRRKRGAGREEGVEKKDRNKVYVSGWPLRWFSISAGRRERANMIFSSTCQQKTDRDGRKVTGKME